MAAFVDGRSDATLASLAEFYARRPAPVSAESRVLALFQEAARDVPAYARFLREHGVEPGTVRDLRAFAQVPATTKDNYYRPNPLPDLCRQGRLETLDMVALSTGSTGEPAVWPRAIGHELESSARFEQILGAFEAGQRRTLAVVCFALGNWVGGLYTLACCRHLAAKGYPITVVAPGNQPAEILRALRALSGFFDQRVLFGYPPFLKDVIDLGAGQGLDWASTPTRLVMAGEVFSEEWRSWVCSRIGAEPASATASMYGTADGGVLANETPLSIRIRRALARRPDAARALFGEARLPTLCQYDPAHRYFEVEDGWLLFTGDGGAPLLRYKILDRGGVIGFAAMREFLARHAVELEAPGLEASLEAPFVYVFGRSFFAVSFYGANIYPENVAVGLEQPELTAYLTGKFVLEVEHDQDQSAHLRLTVELARGEVEREGLRRQIAAHVRGHLERLNSEFASYVPDAERSPRVALRAFGDPEFFPAGVKHRYTR